jgi:hypothetical protein
MSGTLAKLPILVAQRHLSATGSLPLLMWGPLLTHLASSDLIDGKTSHAKPGARPKNKKKSKKNKKKAGVGLG